MIKREYPEESAILNSTNIPKNFDNYVMTIETDQADNLPLVHPELIGWDDTKLIEVDTFPNDHAIFVYLNAIEPVIPKRASTSESNNASCSREGAKSSSRKSEIIKQRRRSNAENHFKATLDQ